MDKTLVVISGGTIDACAYRQTPENITPLETSIIPDAVRMLGFAEECVFYSWLRKDSKDITETDLRDLANIIDHQGYKHVVITHGTDRMVQNAALMLKQDVIAGSDKVIVFTGAMVPLANEIEGYEKSDGYGNLRYSLTQVKTAKPGVYIGFQDKLFDPLRTHKDFKNKILVES